MICCLFYFRSKQQAVEVAVDVEWETLCDFFQILAGSAQLEMQELIRSPEL